MNGSALYEPPRADISGENRLIKRDNVLGTVPAMDLKAVGNSSGIWTIRMLNKADTSSLTIIDNATNGQVVPAGIAAYNKHSKPLHRKAPAALNLLPYLIKNSPRKYPGTSMTDMMKNSR